MAVKNFKRGENVYKVTYKTNVVQSILNVTKNVLIPLDTSTGRRIIKGHHRYVEVK
jgi:hypothetical protein